MEVIKVGYWECELGEGKALGGRHRGGRFVEVCTGK